MEKYGDLPDNSWGNQIRTYISHQYNLVKDNRTGCETPNIRKVLDGDLDEFLRASVIFFNQRE
jgi:peptide chain release factor 2